MKAGVDGRLYTSSMLLLSRTVRCLGGIIFLNALLDCSQKDLIDAQVHEHSLVSLPTIAITTDQSSPSSSDIPHKRLRPRPRLSSRAVCRPASQPRPRPLELQNPNASLAASESTKWGVFPQVAQVFRTFATPVVGSSNLERSRVMPSAMRKRSIAVRDTSEIQAEGLLKHSASHGRA